MKKIFSTLHTNNRTDTAILVLRIGIALLMLTHGYPKLKSFMQGDTGFMSVFGFSEPVSMGFAIFAEFFCSLLILFGLGTRLAVIPLSITMLVAVLQVHGQDAFSKKELALHFLLVYIILFILGSGKYSIDQFLLRKKNYKIKLNS